MMDPESAVPGHSDPDRGGGATAVQPESSPVTAQFFQSPTSIAAYTVMVGCTLVMDAFSVHLFFFIRLKSVELSANDRYLISLTATSLVQQATAVARSVVDAVGPTDVDAVYVVLEGLGNGLLLYSQATILSLLVNRYLFITLGALYDGPWNIRISKVVTAAAFIAAFLVGATVAAPRLKAVDAVVVLHQCLVLVISSGILAFDVYKNVVIYRITAKTLTDQQRLDFVRRRTKKVGVLVVNVVVTAVQTLNALAGVLLGAVDDELGVGTSLNRTHARNVSAFCLGLYVVWYIVTDEKWRLLYKKRGLLAISCR